MLWLAVLLLAAQDGEPRHRSISFSVTPPLRGAAVQVQIGVVPRRPGAPLDYWFERTIVPRYHPRLVASTDTSRCPAARAALAEMPNVAMPRFEPVPRSSPLPLETLYELDAPAAYPDARGTRALRIAAGPRSPVALWIERAQALLEDCWRPGRWTAARRPLTSH